jgi:peroxiredoxin
VNLQLQLYKFQREFLVKFPPKKAEIMQNAIEALTKEFQNRRTLKVDDQAPDFVLKNIDGKSIRLSKKLQTGAVLVSFYFGSWCPYCNLELRAYQGLLPKISSLGSSMIAISPQTLDASRKTALRNSLSFDLLSDKHCQVAHDYGIVFEVSDPLKQLYRELGHPLPNYNGTEDWLLPVPATFVIDRQQQIALAHIDVDYSKRYEPTEAIAILLSLFVSH